jgi:hypothetical protein
MHPSRIAQILKDDMPIPRPCVLCGKPTRGRDVFEPHDPVDFGVERRPGKTRLFIIPVCEACVRDDTPPGWAVRVERAIMDLPVTEVPDAA